VLQKRGGEKSLGEKRKGKGEMEEGSYNSIFGTSSWSVPDTQRPKIRQNRGRGDTHLMQEGRHLGKTLFIEGILPGIHKKRGGDKQKKGSGPKREKEESLMVAGRTSELTKYKGAWKREKERTQQSLRQKKRGQRPHKTRSESRTTSKKKSCHKKKGESQKKGKIGERRRSRSQNAGGRNLSLAQPVDGKGDKTKRRKRRREEVRGKATIKTGGDGKKKGVRNCRRRLEEKKYLPGINAVL